MEINLFKSTNNYRIKTWIMAKWKDFHTVLLELFSMKFGKQPTYFIFQDCNKRLHFAFQCNLHRVKIAHAFKFIFGSSSNMSVIWFLILHYLKVWVFNTKPLLSSYQNCPNARCNGNYSVVKILIPWNKPGWIFILYITWWIENWKKSFDGQRHNYKNI